MDLDLINMVSWFTPFFEPLRDVNDWTPLHHAAISGKAAIVNAMLTWRPKIAEGRSSQGANPNITTCAGFTPLHLAVGPGAPLKEQQQEIVSALLSHGADINAPEGRRYTPLHIAAKCHNLDVLFQLLTFDPSSTNADYVALNPSTPLDLALRDHGSSFETAEPIARMLLLAGADVNHAAGDGKTALHHAVRARNMPLIRLFRKSITSLFPDLKLEHSLTNKSPSKSHTSVKMTDLSTSLGKAFSSGWPTWRSIRGGDQQTPTFTIRLASELKAHALEMNLAADPATVIAKARDASVGAASGNIFSEMWAEIEQGLVTLVYGSNKIESAGSSLGITVKLCRDVLRGKNVLADIEEGSAEYKEHADHLKQAQRASDKSSVIRSRIEVIQHAKALNFLIDQVVLSGYNLTEELILHTHAILYHGLEDDDVVAGKYRTHEVAVSYGKPGEKKKKTDMCMRASAVPRYMKELVEHLKDDITNNAERVNEIDPYTLAARYHHHFVMIHPFGDGNGRMSRIILNVLLLKYAGHLSLFGSDNKDKDDYLAVVGRGRKLFNDEDMEIEFENQTSHQEFARYVLFKSKRSLESMWNWAKAGKSK
ncbi:ankyrin repeat-containing domain protein [Cercophora newfieldiana]|uniref:Ankyrin repeat-containing domain protein n=1 Tax=Cercophora newfieldiana TaxID=92897 RepID=A0AA40CHH8_9PEZI|nr:ankyrin repeat-containing domain protein [Cercophora newfieldiana]